MLPTLDREADYILSYPPELYMECYSNNAYPFKLFDVKGPHKIEFEPITVFYGSNGSGKSTLLNIISEKLSLVRSGPFNDTPFFAPYLELCTFEAKDISEESVIIRSDDVFGRILDIRHLNEGVDGMRENLFSDYKERHDYLSRHGESFRLSSLDDYEELKAHNDARRRTKSQYVSERLPYNIRTFSNGENAFEYFAEKIPDGALCLLDEPENSLAYPLQAELMQFVYDSARFYGTQFVISTHSPFFLSLPGAKIYDLDRNPVSVTEWTELPNIRALKELFDRHKNEFI